MGEFAKAALVRADQFHFDQGNVGAFVVVEIIDGGNEGGGGEFIHIQLVLVLPVRVIHEQVGHKGDAGFVENIASMAGVGKWKGAERAVGKLPSFRRRPKGHGEQVGGQARE